MKKIASLVLLIVGLSSYACWFSSADFKNNYIAGVNNYEVHYTPGSSANSAVYYNGQEVSFPLTVYVKTAPRAGTDKVVVAILQYKVEGSSEWVTIDMITDQKDLNLGIATTIFGRNIDLPIADGKFFYLRLYLSDGVNETGNLEEDITVSISNTMTSGSQNLGGGWTPPFVFKLKKSANKRPTLQ